MVTIYILGKKLSIAVAFNLHMLQPFNTVFHVVVNIMNHSVNIQQTEYLIFDPCKRVI